MEHKKIENLHSKLKDRDEAISYLLLENIEVRKSMDQPRLDWRGELDAKWAKADIRDNIVLFASMMTAKTNTPVNELI